MRARPMSAAVACCVFSLMTDPAPALQSNETSSAAAESPGVQCQNKPNLIYVEATMGEPYLLEGAQPETVADDVIMIDFDISVRNAGDADAPNSSIGYAVKISSVEGGLVETFTGVAELDWTPAGATEHAYVSIMFDKLADLLRPSGEIEGSIELSATIDVDGEVDECDETDNAGELTVELNVGGEAEQS